MAVRHCAALLSVRDRGMRDSRISTMCLLVLSCVTVAGCHSAGTSPERSKIAGYEVRASAGVRRSVVQPALRAAGAAPELRAPPERFPLVRIVGGPDEASDRVVRVEFQGYMEGYVVGLTNSVCGWRVKSISRMLE